MSVSGRAAYDNGFPRELTISPLGECKPQKYVQPAQPAVRDWDVARGIVHAGYAEPRDALDELCASMALILNHFPMQESYYAKFGDEVARHRKLLSKLCTAAPSNGV